MDHAMRVRADDCEKACSVCLLTAPNGVLEVVAHWDQRPE